MEFIRDEEGVLQTIKRKCNSRLCVRAIFEWMTLAIPMCIPPNPHFLPLSILQIAMLSLKPTKDLKGKFSKQGHVFRTWQERYYLLDMEKKELTYYADVEHSVAKGKYEISETSVVETIEEEYQNYKHVLSLKARSSGKESILVISAGSDEKREELFRALTECICGIEIKQPDICSKPFRNTRPLKITYIHRNSRDEEEVVGSNKLLPETVLDRPSVAFEGVLSHLYTLVMFDPDAPSR